jgi:hypothetical protein
MVRWVEVCRVVQTVIKVGTDVAQGTSLPQS